MPIHRLTSPSTLNLLVYYVNIEEKFDLVSPEYLKLGLNKHSLSHGDSENLSTHPKSQICDLKFIFK